MPELKVSLGTNHEESIVNVNELTFEKGRNLEEIDQVFDAEIPAWQFHKFQTDGLSHDLAVLESDKREPKLVEQFEDVERAIPGASTTGKVRQEF